MLIRITFESMTLEGLSVYAKNVLKILEQYGLENISLVNTGINMDSVTLLANSSKGVIINFDELQKKLSEALDDREVDMEFNCKAGEDKLFPIQSPNDFNKLILSSEDKKNAKQSQSTVFPLFHRYMKKAFESSPVNFSILTGYRYPNILRLPGNPFVGKLFDITQPNGMFNTILAAGKLAAESPRKASYFWLGSQPVVFIIEPKDVFQTFILRDANIKRFNFPGFDKFFDAHSFFILNKDKYWRETRDIAKNQFFTRKSLEKNAPTMQSITREFIDEISRKKGEMIDLVDLFNRFSVNLVGRSSLQVKNLPSQTTEFAAQADTIIEYMFNAQHQVASSLPDWLRAKIFPNTPSDPSAIKKTIRDTNEALIFNKENKEMLKDRDSLLNKTSKLYEKHIKGNTEVNSDTFNDPSIDSTDSIISLFFGALYSTATTLLFAFKLINKHPQVKEKLLEELDKLSEIDINHIDQMRYLDCIIKEVMRLYPPNFLIIRKIEESFNLVNPDELTDIHSKEDYNAYCKNPNRKSIDDICLYKDDLIMYSPYLIHRSPSIWKNPDDFIPERFMNNYKPISGAYNPFGIGSQDCLGRKLVLNGMKFMLAQVYKYFDIKIDNNDDFTLETNAIALKLQNPVQACFVKRTNSKELKPENNQGINRFGTRV